MLGLFDGFKTLGSLEISNKQQYATKTLERSNLQIQIQNSTFAFGTSRCIFGSSIYSPRTLARFYERRSETEMWVRGGWILMFAAYHAVQCAAKCDVTAMRVSFCGMDASATPSRPAAHKSPPLALRRGAKRKHLAPRTWVHEQVSLKITRASLP